TGVSGVTLSNGGSGYTSAPTVTFSAPQQAGGIRATGTATIVNGVVTGVTITDRGTGYTAVPTVTFSAPTTGTTPTGTANLVTRAVTITLNLGSGTYRGITPSPKAGITLKIVGAGVTTSILGHSPSLDVSGGGAVIVSDLALTNATDAPTVKVSGGNLTL